MSNKTSPLPEFLVNRYKKWKSTSYLKNEDHFKKLASEGQNPSSMIISCCDSRVHVTSIFDVDEGEFFIHRNIANLVPPYSAEDKYQATSAALEYAIKELKIKHLIILGHSDCGGIKNAYNIYKNNLNTDYQFINTWLSILKPVLNDISGNTAEQNKIKKLEEESLKNSINNLFSFPFIKEAVKNNTLTIHGLIHDIGSGQLKYFNHINNAFEKL